MKIKIFITLLLVTFAMLVQAQSPAYNPESDMADLFYKEGKVYTVVTVVSIVVVGMIVYLFLQDRKLNKLERKIEELKK